MSRRRSGDMRSSEVSAAATCWAESPSTTMPVAPSTTASGAPPERPALTGLPVIAGRSGGAPEAVVEGETGMVVDGDSAQQVAAALTSLLRMSPERRRDMGARGRVLALARHTPDVVGERYRALLQRAAGR